MDPDLGLPTIRASDVQQRPVRWLWERRIPLGKLTLLDGNPGLGKSMLALDLISRVTSGRSMPASVAPAPPSAAIILAGEDDPEDTIVPRLQAAGADRDLVHILPPSSLILLPEGAPALERAIMARRANFVVVDPLSAFARDHEGRRALAPLVAVAQRTGAAILVLRHLSKGGRGPASHRGLGGIGISGLVRSGLICSPDPDDDDSLVLAVYKSNITERPPSIRLAVASVEGGSARIEWLGESPWSADDLVSSSRDHLPSANLRACAFLRDLLETVGGEIAAAEAKERGCRAGIATRTLERASRELMTSARSGFQGHVVWTLRDRTRPREGASPATVRRFEPSPPNDDEIPSE